MKKRLLALSLASALAFTAGTALSAAAQPLDNSAGVTRVIAAKHKARRHAPVESGYIACTVVGCARVAPGCRPVTDYDWDGMPTGFDAVQCPNGKFYSRS